eukprot:scaffold346966_cov53-Prasinocladus_malaysianus.AAC.1
MCCVDVKAELLRGVCQSNGDGYVPSRIYSNPPRRHKFSYEARTRSNLRHASTDTSILMYANVRKLIRVRVLCRTSQGPGKGQNRSHIFVIPVALLAVEAPLARR